MNDTEKKAIWKILNDLSLKLESHNKHCDEWKIQVADWMIDKQNKLEYLDKEQEHAGNTFNQFTNKMITEMARKIEKLESSRINVKKSGMTFHEAIEAIKSGKVVKKSTWDQCDNGMTKPTNINAIVFSWDDVTATDWEIVS